MDFNKRSDIGSIENISSISLMCVPLGTYLHFYNCLCRTPKALINNHTLILQHSFTKWLQFDAKFSNFFHWVKLF
jgi:hypothetical protein